VVLGIVETASDVAIATKPASSAAYYTPLAQELDAVHALGDYRLEVVQDGTHTAAYAVLNHATLARGYETQADNEFDSVLTRSTLDAASYKQWLDQNAVNLVAISRTAVHSSPEYTLVSRHRPAYLSRIWSSTGWLVYRVADATPIVGAPEAMIDPDQSTMTISVPCACTFSVRVRWSRLLRASAAASHHGAEVSNDGTGWTIVRTTRAGLYTLHGA
jgi:hypothetical protein